MIKTTKKICKEMEGVHEAKNLTVSQTNSLKNRCYRLNIFLGH